MLSVGRFRLVLEGSSAGRAGDASRRRRTRTGVALLAAGVLALGSGVGFAVVESRAGDTITACVSKKDGAARIVGAGSSCRTGERKVRWSKVGPVGPAGPQGLTGAAGTPGAPGAPGAAGVEEFGDLAGLPCTRDSQTGTIALSFDTGGVAVTRCVLAGDGPVCGDGVPEGGEACDDGNDDPHDACTNSCAAAACGDSVVQVGTEQCDSGGSDSVSCDSNCTISYCGDGTTNASAGEACDTSGSNTPSCDYDCSIPTCGDGVVNTAAGEQCDDANQNNGDSCSNVCTWTGP